MKKIAIVLLVMLGVLLTSLLFIGCKTKNVSNTSVTNDSATIKSLVNKTSSINDSVRAIPKVEIKYVISNPCDSLGKLKPINQSTTSGSGKSTIKSKGDTLLIDCDCDEQIQRFRTEIKNKDSLVYQLKTSAIMQHEKQTVTIKEIPWYAYLIMAILVLTNLITIIKFR